MTSRYLLSIDQGTTGSTALFLDVKNPANPVVAAKATVDFPQHFPKAGWVEHDLNEIWASVISAISKAAAQMGGEAALKQIAGIGISNQRETICVFDRKTSEPLCKAIVWQCRRSTDICAEFKEQGAETMVRAKTGLVLDPYFSASKITWLVRNRPEIAKALSSGNAVLGTIECWLTHKLTGGSVHATESSNASRTMLFDIHANRWDGDLIKMFELPSMSCLPEVRTSAGDFGKTKGVKGLPDGIPVSGILGDQQAALAGQTCFEVGEAKCTFGTGAFLLINSGNKAPVQGKGVLTTIAWNLSGKITYALEGSSFIAGAAVQFIRDQFHFMSLSKDSEAMALRGRAAPDLYFVPALAGLSAPWWEPKARGAFLGMHRGTTTDDIARATLEGIALQVADLANSMTSLLGNDLKILRADGGAAANEFLMRLQSDLLGVTVDRPRDIESTAIGAALFAGLGAGIYRGLNDLTKARTSEKLFHPGTDADTIERVKAMKAGWARAIAAVRVFAGNS